MSLSLGGSKSKSSSKSQSEPWAPTIPFLEDYLGQIGGLDATAPSSDQTVAAGNLKDIYGQGNQFQGALSNLANDFFTGPQSRAGMAEDAYSTLQGHLKPYADGKFLDFAQNPYIEKMLQNVGDDVQSRINAQFSAAGRDSSGMNQQAVGRGVTQAQLPLLMDLYSKEQDRALGAANALYGAGTGTAQVAQGLDTSALTTRAGGIPAAQAATDASMWGDQGIFNLEQIMGELPFNKLAQLGSLLLPVAQLGQQQEGSGKQSGTQWGVGAKLLSDERLKEDIEEIGMMADGTPLVRFRYKGEDTVRIGVRAQDVEELSPEAISEYAAPQAGTDDGMVKYVDMDAATRRSADMMKQQGMRPLLEEDEELLPPPMATATNMPRPMLEDEEYMGRRAA